MSYASIKKETVEPLLTGDLNERFYKAVHEEPALFYDVVQTGWLNGMLPYEMVLLHSGNVDNALLGKMMALQDKTAKVKSPDEGNAIDYKSEEEVIAHYSGNGLGLGIFTAEGDLVGQTMLSFKQDVNGRDTGALISWLMVDRGYGPNNLCQSLISMACRMAESSGMSEIAAHVRLHNEKGIGKFSSEGFVVTGTGTNAKDGSRNLKFSKDLNREMRIDWQKEHPRPQPLAGLQSHNLPRLEALLEEGYVAKWNRAAKWFICHPFEQEQPAPPLQMVKLEL